MLQAPLHVIDQDAGFQTTYSLDLLTEQDGSSGQTRFQTVEGSQIQLEIQNVDDTPEAPVTSKSGQSGITLTLPLDASGMNLLQNVNPGQGSFPPNQVVSMAMEGAPEGSMTLTPMEANPGSFAAGPNMMLLSQCVAQMAPDSKVEIQTPSEGQGMVINIVSPPPSTPQKPSARGRFKCPRLKLLEF